MPAPIEVYHQSQQFDSHVSFRQFALNYYIYSGDQGWRGRKIGALPGAALSTAAFAIRLILAGVLGSAQSLYYQDSKYLKLHTFTALREGEFALGRLLSLFNDLRGCFVMARAEAKQKSYQEKLHQNLCLYGCRDLIENIATCGAPEEDSFIF